MSCFNCKKLTTVPASKNENIHFLVMACEATKERFGLVMDLEAKMPVNCRYKELRSTEK